MNGLDKFSGNQSPGIASGIRILLSFERNIPISVVIENTGDRPATILEYYTKLSPSFIKDEINHKPLFNLIGSGEVQSKSINQ